MFELVVKFVLNIFSFAAMVAMTFSLFRIPIKGNDKQIAIIALIVGSANFYFKFVLESQYFTSVQIILWVIALMIIRKYPLLYSLAVCVIGSILITLVDVIVTFGATGLNIATMDQILNDTSYYVVFHLITAAIYIIIAILLAKLNLGFSFIIKRFSGAYSIKTYNFVCAIVMIVSIFLIQIGAMNIRDNSLHFFLVILFAALLVISILLAYFHNKKLVADRQLKKKG